MHSTLCSNKYLCIWYSHFVIFIVEAPIWDRKYKYFPAWQMHPTSRQKAAAALLCPLLLLLLACAGAASLCGYIEVYGTRRTSWDTQQHDTRIRAAAAQRRPQAQQHSGACSAGCFSNIKYQYSKIWDSYCKNAILVNNSVLILFESID